MRPGYSESSMPWKRGALDGAFDLVDGSVEAALVDLEG
jgi:hypothetical protein